MFKKEKYSCTNELVAEILMYITSYFIVWFNCFRSLYIISEKTYGLILSSVYALFLPLMSFLFSQAKQYYSEERAQQILFWMVLIEFMRLRGDPIFTWELRKSVEQLVRLFWVAFLVHSYAPLHGVRISLFILCIFFSIIEVLKGIAFKEAKDSYLIGKNPKLIHNYVKRVFLDDELKTIPFSSCDYIVMGENDNEIDVCSNGYQLIPNSEGMLTVGRVFELTNSSEGDPPGWQAQFSSWRETCLSIALAKMLTRRFAKLPVDEAGCEKARDFVLKGLINGNDGEIRNPMERVFCIIQQELKFVSEYFHMKVPVAYNYNYWYAGVDFIGTCIVLGNGIYLYRSTTLNSVIWISDEVMEGYSHCLFNLLRHSTAVLKLLNFLDEFITFSLVVGCFYLQTRGMRSWFHSQRWETVKSIKRYIENPDKWKESHPKPEIPKAQGENKNAKKPRSVSVFDKHAETLLFCVKVDLSILARLPKCIRKKVPRSFPTVIYSYVAEEAVLRSLRNSDGRLTNGETSLKKYKMETLNWACQPNGSTTEAILIWHIATTLFHHQGQKSSPQEPAAPEQNNNQEVALVISTYCHYLVAYRPELLPDEVEWTQEKYDSVRKDILDNPKTNDHYNYALETTWGDNSLVGKGAKLAEELINCAEGRSQVWKMLAEFWPEMMLFIAPSDNVKGHRKILHKKEFITQLWALLTHAGIVTRPTPTEHKDHEGDSNAVPREESNAVPGEESNAVPGESNAVLGDEINAIRGEESNAVPREESNAVPGEESNAVPGESNAVLGDEINAIRGEESNAVPREESNAVPGEESNAVPGESNAVLGDENV